MQFQAASVEDAQLLEAIATWHSEPSEDTTALGWFTPEQLATRELKLPSTRWS